MTAEFGHIALIAAFLVACAQATLPLWGARTRDLRLMAIGDRAAVAQCVLIGVAFIALTVTFLQSDFSVKLAATHSHTDKPLLYKISGVWGNHEGSMLLWIVMLSVFGAMVPVFGRDLPATLRARALAVQGMIGVGFLGFLLFTSNPFERLFPVPANGQGLNPLLQDPGLALHPPFLYLGYVGFSMAFSFSVAALMEGRVDAVWARWLRPWVLIAWSFLTIGITMGSVWAYYELGWGGWWMWDPVENVSFMPWLIGTALLHSIMVLGTRHTMASWTVLLGIAAFSFSLIGTFVVRSGVLVSVHAFAVDPARGVVILVLLMLAIGGALSLYAMRADKLRSYGRVEGLSKEGGLVLNNLLLVAATATVFLGTFYPLFIDAISGDKISVGAPYFDLTFTPLMLLLIGFMGIGPLIKWRVDSWARIKPILVRLLIGALIIAALFGLIGRSVGAAVGFGFAAWLAFGTLRSMADKTRWGKVSAGDAWTLLKRQPAAFHGFVIAHLGLAVLTAGVTAMSVWADENVGRLKPGETLSVAGYDYTLESVTSGERENYQLISALVTISKNNRDIAQVKSERRFYPVRDMITTEAGFRLSPGATLFAAIGEGDPETGWIMRIYYHPAVVWIWFGAFMMALAGFVSLGDRRLRQKTSVASVAPTVVAAE